MTSQIEALGLSHLNTKERLALIGELWESVHADDDAEVEPLCDEAKAEIDRRLAAHAADPSGAVPWEEAEARIRARIQARRRK
jgi:putative addiction module component (TIGR02574 family)